MRVMIDVDYEPDKNLTRSQGGVQRMMGGGPVDGVTPVVELLDQVYRDTRASLMGAGKETGASEYQKVVAEREALWRELRTFRLYLSGLVGNGVTLDDQALRSEIGRRMNEYQKMAGLVDDLLENDGSGDRVAVDNVVRSLRTMRERTAQ